MTNDANWCQDTPVKDMAMEVTRAEAWRAQELAAHCHDGMELFLCVEGCIDCEIERQRLHVRTGDFVMIAPGITHRAIASSAMEAPCRRVSVRIGAEMTRILENFQTLALCDVMHGGFCCLRTSGTRWAHLATFCQSICEETARRQAGWEAIVYGNVFTLLGLLLRAMDEERTVGPEQQDLLERIVHYVTENLDQKITLSDTARRFLVSESSVSKIFRKRMDISFYKYVIRERLIAARRLIADGFPIEQIYSQVGFCDHAAFYRAFRSECGMSPQQYRQTCASGGGRIV